MRPRRHEERVEKLGSAIECRVAGGELDFDLVLSRPEIRRGDHDVIRD